MYMNFLHNSTKILLLLMLYQYHNSTQFCTMPYPGCEDLLLQCILSTSLDNSAQFRILIVMICSCSVSESQFCAIPWGCCSSRQLFFFVSSFILFSACRSTLRINWDKQLCKFSQSTNSVIRSSEQLCKHYFSIDAEFWVALYLKIWRICGSFDVSGIYPW